MFKLDLEKAEEPEIKLPTSVGSLKKRVPEKHLLLLYWLYESFWLYGSQQTVENSARDEISDHLTCLLRNLYAGQEATVRTEHGTTDWFQTRKEVYQDCIFSPCQRWYVCHDAEYILWNAEQDEAQPGIKIAGGNINNFSYADNTTLVAEKEEDLKSLLMKEESENFGLKLNIWKMKIMVSSLIAS